MKQVTFSILLLLALGVVIYVDNLPKPNIQPFFDWADFVVELLTPTARL